ncbi:MAG: hypothetical protein ACX932_00230 [Gammaproteobacteria bacterium]
MLDFSFGHRRRKINHIIYYSLYKIFFHPLAHHADNFLLYGYGGIVNSFRMVFNNCFLTVKTGAGSVRRQLSVLAHHKPLAKDGNGRQG